MKPSLADLLPAVSQATTASGFDVLGLETVTEPLHEQRFLSISLQTQETALFPVDPVAEILRIPMIDVLPVPQLSSSVLGIVNRRGEMLWLVDLGHLLGNPLSFQPGHAFATGMAIVLEVEGLRLGLVVPQVNDIEAHNADLIQSPSPQLFSAKLLPFLQGYFSHSGVIVLDPGAIFRSPLLEGSFRV